MVTASRHATLPALALLTLGLVAFPSGGCEPTRREGGRRSAAAPPPTSRVAAIERYIRRSWGELTRSHANVLASFPAGTTRAQRVVYYSRLEREDRVRLALRAGAKDAAARVTLRPLPSSPGEITTHGLLFLPRPYVVPGGRFVEQYGWDSYFILLGLLRDGETRLARDMVENFVYEIEHYGFILNANRTTFLTRSQPPFLTRMILALPEGAVDRAWLARATRAAVAYHGFWAPTATRTPPRHVNETGLARYFDDGAGPAPEVAMDRDAKTGATHYDRVRAYYRAHPGADLGYPRAQVYDAATDGLTPAFYLGDRAMRESGFDPSDRFGRFSVDVVGYHPVELNVLLTVMEQDLAALHDRLGRPAEAARWRAAARGRATRIQALLWDEERGLFLDWHLGKKRRSRYPFVTTFFPLWAGLATPAQARRVACNLPLFETPGGVQTSPFRSGSQWDAPYVWAPTHLVAVLGLRRYGYLAEARRLSRNYLSMVLADFLRTGTIVEKYDGVTRSSRVSLTYGYTTQEIGFGWTNAAFVVLLDLLSAADRQALEATGVPPLPAAAPAGCPPPTSVPSAPVW